MAYFRVCPHCGGKIRVDDIDFNFEGCQDEYSFCDTCHISYFVKVRYGKVWNVQEKAMYFDEHDQCWYTLDGGDNL